MYAICAKKKLNHYYQRFSNNNNPKFTDQESITIYLYSMHVEHRFKVKHIYEFTSEHLRSLFSKFPSYVAYTNRINRLNEAFKGMDKDILTKYQSLDCYTNKPLLFPCQLSIVQENVLQRLRQKLPTNDTVLPKACSVTD